MGGATWNTNTEENVEIIGCVEPQTLDCNQVPIIFTSIYICEPTTSLRKSRAID